MAQRRHRARRTWCSAVCSSLFSTQHSVRHKHYLVAHSQIPKHPAAFHFLAKYPLYSERDGASSGCQGTIDVVQMHTGGASIRCCFWSPYGPPLGPSRHPDYFEASTRHMNIDCTYAYALCSAFVTLTLFPTPSDFRLFYSSLAPGGPLRTLCRYQSHLGKTKPRAFAHAFTPSRAARSLPTS